MAFPTMNAYENGSQIAGSLVEELRDRFLEDVAKNPELYYGQDIERIKTNNWSLQRFLGHHKSNVDKSLESLVKAMKWRKTFGVLELKDSDFPREAYMSAGIIVYGKDLNGSELMIMRAKVARKIKSWVPTAQRFLVYLIEKIDATNTGKGVTLLMDCKGAGVKNADVDFLQFIHNVLNDYYPGLVNAILVYKLPVVLEAIYKMVRTWLNDEQKKYIYLIKKKTINEYVAKDQLPDFLLGTNTQPYRDVPKDAPTALELAKRLGLKEGKAEKMIKHLEQFFTE
jgi:hypothetical protein